MQNELRDRLKQDIVDILSAYMKLGFTGMITIKLAMSDGNVRQCEKIVEEKMKLK